MCSKSCAATVARGAPRADRVEDAGFLLSTGTSPVEIADRLGLKAGSLARALRRAGRPDLARPFDRVAKAARREASSP